jgi:alpha-glucosidase/alpha-D-xyloside xylohydrolase
MLSKYWSMAGDLYRTLVGEWDVRWVPQAGLRLVWLMAGGLISLMLAVSLGSPAMAQSRPLVLEREGGVLSLDPYAPNILRVTFSIDRAAATGPSGYGIAAKPSAAGWTHERDAEGRDVYRSARIVVRVSLPHLPREKQPQAMPLDALNRQLRDPYFGGAGGNNSHEDELLVTTAAGKTLLRMRSWTMAPERAEVAQADAGTKGYTVSSRFESPADEHYYGLGSSSGLMTATTRSVAGMTTAPRGENVCVPFMV